MTHGAADSTIRLYATGELQICSSPCRRPARNKNNNLDQKTKVQGGTAIANSCTIGGAKGGRGAIPAPTKFGRRAKRTLREAGTIFDEYFPATTAFFTLTLPGSGALAHQAIARYSAVVVERVTQWLRDAMGAQAIAWVWEWQRRGALHLHILAAGEDGERVAEAIMRWRQYCGDLMERLSLMSGVDCFWNPRKKRWNLNWQTWQFDATLVAKSAARYLAKYVGKAVNGKWKGERYYPSRWWSVNKFLLARIYCRRVAARMTWKTHADRQQGLAAIVAHLSADGANILEYANKRYWWLANWLARFDDDTCMLAWIGAYLRQAASSLTAGCSKLLWGSLRAPAVVAEPEPDWTGLTAVERMELVGLRPLRHIEAQG